LSIHAAFAFVFLLVVQFEFFEFEFEFKLNLFISIAKWKTSLPLPSSPAQFSFSSSQPGPRISFSLSLSSIPPAQNSSPGPTRAPGLIHLFPLSLSRQQESLAYQLRLPRGARLWFEPELDPGRVGARTPRSALDPIKGTRDPLDPSSQPPPPPLLSSTLARTAAIVELGVAHRAFVPLPFLDDLTAPELRVVV
jgi:hypothetical protein